MGNRVKEIMQQKGITIQKLAERAEVSRRTVQNLLHNDTDCTVETLRKLARAMEVSVAELLLEPHEQIVRADRFQGVQERRTAAEERGAATGEHGAVAEEHGGYKVPAKTPQRTEKKIMNCWQPLRCIAFLLCRPRCRGNSLRAIRRKPERRPDSMKFLSILIEM